MTIDIPGAFMHSDMDELIHVHLKGAMVDLLIRVNPGKYEKYIVYKNGKKVLYVKLQKALYGTLQVALLFWENVSAFLVNELGFEMNPYDKCVVNKIINGKQCTIIWHVDDFKLSHGCVKYLHGMKDLILTLEVRKGMAIKWYIDASFAVHPDMQSHLGGTMTVGKGSIYSFSRKQRINTKSSTEAKLVAVDDGLPLVLWMHNFLEAQGFEVTDNVVYQDNLSAIQLEKNG